MPGEGHNGRSSPTDTAGIIAETTARGRVRLYIFFVGFLVHKSSVCGCYKCLVPGNTDRYIVSCCAAPSYWKFVRAGRMGQLEQWSGLVLDHLRPFGTIEWIYPAFAGRMACVLWCYSRETFWSGHGALVSGFIDWLLRVRSLGSTNWWYLPPPTMPLQRLSSLSIYHESPRPHDVQPQSPNHPVMNDLYDTEEQPSSWRPAADALCW